MAKNKRGFTLIELVVVVLIMGILASMGVPYYFKTLEVSKATDSVAIGHLLGNANRMYLIDNPLGVTGQMTAACNSSVTTCAAAAGACKLVACGYVAQQDWGGSSYDYFVCNGPGGGCCANSMTGAKGVSCATRKAGAISPYSGWGYRFFSDGTCKAIAATSGPGSQPDCPQF